MDGARLLTRLIRNIDFACRDDDGALLIAFTQTDLRSAHVIARRIAGALKNALLAPTGGHAKIAANADAGDAEGRRHARQPAAARDGRPDGCGGMSAGIA